jgi:protoheme IX farnesyltransferase
MKAQTAEVPRISSLGDLLELTKPRITLMVVVTTLVGLLVAAPAAGGGSMMWLALATIVGTALMAASSSVLNMWWEREHDRHMERTVERPLAAGRIEPERALWFGIALGASGLGLLAWWVNPLTAFLGLLTVVLYLFVYTPLKRRTHWSTVVGAVPGAIPPMMGWTAAHNDLSAPAWVLFAILFFWQMPHFYAIAWLYREDYRRAGFRMLSGDDLGGGRTGRFMVAFTLGLLIASALPGTVGLSGLPYLIPAAVLSLGFLWMSVGFARVRDRLSARKVMLYSVLYLPLILGLLVVDRWV